MKCDNLSVADKLINIIQILSELKKAQKHSIRNLIFSLHWHGLSKRFGQRADVSFEASLSRPEEMLLGE